MPALDPFSAASKWSSIPVDSAPSNPLSFGATLQPLDPNLLPNSSLANTSGKGASGPSLSNGRPPRPPRQYKEPLPEVFPSPIWNRHERAASISSETVRVGSDEWMDAQLQICIDKAEPTLHLNKKGLTSLSTKVADLQHLVAFPSSRSTFSASTSSRPAPTPTPSPFASPSVSPLPPHPAQSPGRDPFSSDARPFTRTASAPASAAAVFRSTSGTAPGSSSSGLHAPRAAFARVPSGLRGLSLLDSPLISEINEEITVSSEAEETARDASGTGAPAGLAEGLWPSQAGLKRQFGRSHTRAVLPTPPPAAAVSSKGPVIWLQHNELTTLPSALFEISNLTTLSLSHNKLTELPAAIGALHSLTELNIGGNQLRYLPHTILSLKFDTLSVHPNPFLWPPPDDRSPSVDGGILGPLKCHRTTTIPSLFDTSINMLISPRAPSGLPPLLEYETYEPDRGGPHPLLDPVIMRDKYVKIGDERSVARVLRAMRSICTDLDAQARLSSTRLSASTSSQPRSDLFPNLNRPSKPDDASRNPYYSPCPSPQHRIRDVDAPHGHVTRQLYLRPAEERIEWRTLHTWPNIPIKWEGCSPGCLRFLEHDDDAEWELSDEE